MYIEAKAELQVQEMGDLPISTASDSLWSNCQKLWTALAVVFDSCRLAIRCV